MANRFTITGQHYTTERGADGSVVPVVEVSFKTTAEPTIAGKVAVPQSMLNDPVGYAQAVSSAINTVVDAHEAVAKLS